MTEEFAFGPRFSIANRIGAGGMGVVYRAFDRERKGWVALKTLPLAEATAALRFKNEFRSLADVSHPNLVSLHELHSWEGKLFFTMELVEGLDLLSALRVSPNIALVDTLTAPFESDASIPTPRRSAAPDVPKLRITLAELAKGLSALHAAGKLHRDVKPSNVLVAPDGRVVLLDFGLVVELSRDGSPVTAETALVGTAEYMSPEQAAGAELTEASDWYSVGVILYELLTGELPYNGARMKLLLDKQQFDPKPPIEMNAEAPRDLADLAMALLARDPTARPSREKILRTLGSPVANESAPSASAVSANAPFIGRERALTLLSSAFDDARRGHPVTVWVQGASGMGKSQLVRRFLDLLVHRTNSVILAGRCYERDSVPYKALDSIIDALTRHLAKLPKGEAEALLPRDILALARVFPVLRRVPAIANAPQRRTEAPDPQELRRRAFDALREILGRMADRTPLIVWIDDLQWGDSDSAALLADLLSPPNPPPLLLLLSFRAEDAATSSALTVLTANSESERTQTDTRILAVQPLSSSDASTLAHTLLGPGTIDRDEVARTIAKESGGIPFFIDELVRHAQSGIALRRSSLGRALKLDEVLGARIDALPERARDLLELVAVAARPIERATVSRAAQLNSDEERSLFGVLRAARMLRSAGARGREDVECYHDRIRETVLSNLSEQTLKDHHAALASAYETSEHPDVDALLAHYRGAGAVERASEYAARAADRAADALAFDRAAALCRLAMQLGQPNRMLRRKLADALANAGHAADAAIAYAEAVEGATAAEAIDLRRRSAEQLLRSGQVENGVAAVREVLALVGLRLRSHRWMIVLIIWRSIVLRLRGLRFRERDESQLSAEEATRLDVVWTVTTGLAMVDTIRAIAFQRQHLLLALRSGDSFRVARALASEGIAHATSGDSRRADEYVRVAEAVAAKQPSPYTRGWGTLMRGGAAFLCGRWRAAVEQCAEAEQIFRDSCTGVVWETATANIFGVWSLVQLGELKVLGEKLPRLIRSAQERGDLYLYTSLRIGRPNLVWLAANDPDRARRELDDAMDRWPRTEFHLQHYYAMLAGAHIELYRGRAARALADVDATMPRVRASFLLRIQTVNIEALHLRARCALAAHSEGTLERAEMEAIVRRSIRLIRREKSTWGTPLALLLEAALRAQGGDAGEASGVLAEAEMLFSAQGMALWAAVAQLRRGALRGDVPHVVAEAERTMINRGVRVPERFANLFAPGFIDQRSRALPTRKIAP